MERSGLKRLRAQVEWPWFKEEAQAKFSGMPKSAIDTGIVDFVLPVEKMPLQLLKYITHPYIEKARTAQPFDGDFQTNVRKLPFDDSR